MFRGDSLFYFVCLSVLAVLLVQLLHIWGAWGLAAGQSTAQHSVWFHCCILLAFLILSGYLTALYVQDSVLLILPGEGGEQGQMIRRMTLLIIIGMSHT
jgi:hypothetical protein